MQTSARRAYFEPLMSYGFGLLRLHKVDANGVCLCREGKNCRNPGKHIATRYGWQSVITNLDDLEQHLDDGGSVGLSLWYQDQRIPQSPGRLVVFDCDDQYGEAWLRSKGITSPLTVTGKRGVHIICRMPAHVPELKTDTRTLQSPRIDIKVSGLVVMPWSPDKRLHINGRDVSDDPAAVAAFFGDFTTLMASLPEVDPRVLVPDMTERYPAVTVTTAAPGPTTATPAAPPAPRKRVRFTSTRPATFYPGYAGIPYHVRKNNARTHAERLDPSVAGKQPRNKLLKVAADCIIHYGMSDEDTWQIIQDKFNPRCRDRSGGRYPWRKHEVAWAIEIAHQPGSYSTMDAIRGEVDITKALANEERRNQRSNARKMAALEKDRELDYANIRLFLWTYYEEDDSAALPFAELLDALNRALVFQESSPVSRQRLGKLLKKDGITSEDGVVRGLRVRLCDDPSSCSYTDRYRICPASPCSLSYLGGV